MGQPAINLRAVEKLEKREILLALHRAIAGLLGASCNAPGCNNGRILEGPYRGLEADPKCEVCGGTGLAPGVEEMLRELEQDFGVKARRRAHIPPRRRRR